MTITYPAFIFSDNSSAEGVPGITMICSSCLTMCKPASAPAAMKAGIPAKIRLSDVELCAVMGNLLDNALEACAKLPQTERFLRVYIGAIKNQFYLSVQNSAGEVRKSGGKYLTTKQGDSHGYGIFRVDRIAEKYGGYVNRQNEEGIFATEIMIPLNA